MVQVLVLYFVCFKNRVTICKSEECSHKHLTSVFPASLSKLSRVLKYLENL